MTDIAGKEEGAADRVLHVLSVLARASEPLSAAALVEASGLPRSSLYRQLARLKRFGLVQEHAGRYVPGVLCLQLAMGYERGSSLVRTARPFLVHLSQLTQESVGLIVAANGQAICVAMEESTQPLRCTFAEGRSVPLLKGASALCLWAHLPQAEADALLQQHFGAVSLARTQMVERLAQIRREGYAITSHEVDVGVWGCSVPIFGPQRKLAGVLSLMAPLQRAQVAQQAWIEQTVMTASRLSRVLSQSVTQVAWS